MELSNLSSKNIFFRSSYVRREALFIIKCHKRNVGFKIKLKIKNIYITWHNCVTGNSKTKGIDDLYICRLIQQNKIIECIQFVRNFL